MNKDSYGLLKNRVYNTVKFDFNEHPEIAGSNIIITENDLGNAVVLRQKLYSIIYYMVKYQAFFVVKAESAQEKNCVIAGTLTELFNLNRIRSITRDGNWGALTLTYAANDNYNT